MESQAWPGRQSATVSTNPAHFMAHNNQQPVGLGWLHEPRDLYMEGSTQIAQKPVPMFCGKGCTRLRGGNLPLRLSGPYNAPSSSGHSRAPLIALKVVAPEGGIK